MCPQCVQNITLSAPTPPPSLMRRTFRPISFRMCVRTSWTATHFVVFAQICVRVYFTTPLSSNVDDKFFLFAYLATWIRSLHNGPKPATESELYFYQLTSPKVYPIRHASAIRTWWTGKPPID